MRTAKSFFQEDQMKSFKLLVCSLSLSMEGEALHEAGKHDESLATLGQAMKMLGMN
jgi:hypothetical protein